MRFAATMLVLCLAFCTGARADTIELKSGDKLEGTIVSETADTVVLDHPVLGRIEIPKSDIKPPKPPRPGVFGTSFLEGWTKSLSAGVTGSSGKSKDTSINADFSLNRETERNRMNYVARYFFASSDGSTTDNQFDTRYLHDFLIPEQNFFPFLSPFYRYDAEQEWNHRFGIDGGVGYSFLKTDTWDLIGRLGTGVAQTLQGEQRTEWNGVASVQLSWNMIDGMNLSFGTLYQPDFVDLPNFRLESRAEWKISVGYISGLAFKLGGSYIYDSHQTGSDRNDRRYYGNLVYDF